MGVMMFWWCMLTLTILSIRGADYRCIITAKCWFDWEKKSNIKIKAFIIAYKMGGDIEVEKQISPRQNPNFDM